MQPVRGNHHDGILVPRRVRRRVDPEVLQSVADVRPVPGRGIVDHLNSDAQGGPAADDDGAQPAKQRVHVGCRDPEGSGERAHADLRDAFAQLADHLQLPERRLIEPHAITPAELEHRRGAPQGRVGGVDAQHVPIVRGEWAAAVALSTEISRRGEDFSWGGVVLAPPLKAPVLRA
ncbi:hypothetical protein GCM10010459_25770 [Microbacterium schleiferi]